MIRPNNPLASHRLRRVHSRCRSVLASIGLMISLTAPLLSAEAAPAAVSSATYLSSLKSDLEQCWPKNHTIQIVCHGHSVPSGYAKTPVVDTRHAYPRLLHDALCEAYPHAVINVIVTAIGGENSVAGAQRFQRDVLALKPQLITIDYALNDRRIGLEAAKQSWQQMINQAKAANIKVLLLTPTPDLNAKLQDPTDPLVLHAEQIRALAKSNEVGLVDNFAAFLSVTEQIPSLMAQNNHPNAAGHALVLRQLKPWFDLK